MAPILGICEDFIGDNIVDWSSIAETQVNYFFIGDIQRHIFEGNSSNVAKLGTEKT